MELPPKALLLPVIKPKDYLSGGLTGIDYQEVNPSGDWTKWLPTKERQKFKFDTNECSTISATKCLEIQFNFLRNDFTIEALKWFNDNGYIDENGNFNFSERFSGIMAGTSINGNSQNVVWESIRNVGLLPQKDLNYSLEISNQFDTPMDMCKDYYDKAAITQEMKDKALKVLDWVLIQYEWVASGNPNPGGIKKALKQAPVQIGTPVCPDWNTGRVHDCGSRDIAHATTIYGVDYASRGWKDFDHYNPFEKTLSDDYYIPYAVKAVVTIQSTPVKTVSYSVLQQFINLLKKLGLFTIRGLRGIIGK